MKSRYRSHVGLIAALSLLSCTAYATNHPEPPAPAPAPTVSTHSESDASALAAAAAVSGAHATGTGGTSSATAGGGKGVGVGVGAAAAGDSSAVSGPSTATSGDSTSEANGTQALTNVTNYERQVGTLIMGTTIPVDCGFGGQAGEANTSSSGFLGASWTTDRCYTLKVANSWAAMGQYEYACEMLMDVSRNALKRRGIVSVDCAVVGAALRLQHTPPAPVVIDPVPLPPACNDCVTQSQLREYVDKAFRSSVGK